ncbi:MAG: 3-hexulose-6-phosphate synthase [Lachnospiraceae bacterium]|nr:3-hexulose-6-phosphate synthase [Lachnospiraceae bacterium]
MKLQLALDTFGLEEALNLAEKVKNYVDIIEIGTPFILENGMEAVRCFRKKFPDKRILADTKIMDAGKLEAAAAFEAGADYITVLAVTDRATIEECLETAEKFGKKVVADMICVDNIPKKTEELEAAGVDGIAVHTGVDQQKRGRTPLDDLKIVKENCKRTSIFVAGGITLATLPEYAALSPDVLIVGGGIGNAADPEKEAKLIYQKLQEYTV